MLTAATRFSVRCRSIKRTDGIGGFWLTCLHSDYILLGRTDIKPFTIPDELNGFETVDDLKNYLHWKFCVEELGYM
jgi:hypothetical protein